MQRHGTHVERTAYERRRPAPTLGRALAAAGVPLLLLAVLAEPLMAVLSLEALVLVAARRRL
jgi:hypothetical protein